MVSKANSKALPIPTRKESILSWSKSDTARNMAGMTKTPRMISFQSYLSLSNQGSRIAVNSEVVARVISAIEALPSLIEA